MSGNVAASAGGGLYSSGSVSLNNVTIALNTATQGGGVTQINGSLTLSNTLLGGNTGGDCYGSLTSAGYNLIQTPNCTLTGDLMGNIIGQNPLLNVLEDNGGNTLTHALIEGLSPALNAGSTAGSGSGGACATTDQRGTPRPQGERCDIGAYEGVVIVPFVPDFLSTSPVNGESGVAVTRETILRFRDPLDPASIANAFRAVFGGQVLDARLHLSPDQRTVTLFYSSRLPANARITVTVLW